MDTEVEILEGGSVTSPPGFLAGAVHCGLRTQSQEPDLGILHSQVPCVAAGVFTTNRIKAAPVLLSQQRLEDGRARGVVVNSGCANSFTGEQGMADAAEMAELAAKRVGASPEEVLVASTGLIGPRLPMELVRAGINRITLSREGGLELARAMMTTDTVPKETAVRVSENNFIIGGAAKGSGMIHPDLATLLCFLTTDARLDLDFLRAALRQAVDVSFNMISIDGDTSPNDMVLLMANGLAGNESISEGSQQADRFQQALNQLCIHLAKALARDGEGASKLIEVNVSGAPSLTEARLVARTIVSSPLVKAAIHGNDPNWGRIVAAAGRSGVAMEAAKLDLYLGNFCLVKAGHPLSVDNEGAVKELEGSEVSINLNLNIGGVTATAWGCDLSEEYVTINSQYTT